MTEELSSQKKNRKNFSENMSKPDFSEKVGKILLPLALIMLAFSLLYYISVSFERKSVIVTKIRDSGSPINSTGSSKPSKNVPLNSSTADANRPNRIIEFTPSSETAPSPSTTRYRWIKNRTTIKQTGNLPNSSPAPGKRLNINEASADDLTKLPGIGPKKALWIVEYRNKHGPFRKAEDIKKVQGIGIKTYMIIKYIIVVE